MTDTIPSFDSLEIKVKDLSKTFEKELIAKNFSFHFKAGSKTAITGFNGSGKSTLLKMLAGLMLPNKGEISYTINNEVIHSDHWFKHNTFCAPAQELIEEFTLLEMLHFHLKFRNFISGMDIASFLSIVFLSKEKNKRISLFSSGMKQRLKLGLALYTKSLVIFLDEPTSNLDEQGINWYQEQIQLVVKNRLLIIASNQKEEYSFCDEIINMSEIKA